MGCLKTFAVLTSVCIIALSVYIYTPVPDNIDERWKVTAFVSLYKAMNLLGSIMAAIGVDSNINCTRLMYNKFTTMGVTSNSESLLEVTETSFDGVHVRIYRPKTAKAPGPAMVYFHGGGWTLGSLDTVDPFCVEVAKSATILIVSVEYRLAPEYPFPIPFEDCVTATLHLQHNSEKYGIDRNKVVVAGDSAGGNLAAAVALFFSNNPKLPSISLQILIYPVMQSIDFKLPSYINPKNHNLVVPIMMTNCWSNYVGPTTHSNLPQALMENQHTSPAIKKSHYAKLVNVSLHMPKKFLGKVEPGDLESGNETLWKEIESRILNPYMSPLIAEDVSKVAPAVIVTAEHDILRDEGILYAERLRKSGVKVKHRNLNMLHGFALLPHLFEIGREATRGTVNDLKEHFHSD